MNNAAKTIQLSDTTDSIRLHLNLQSSSIRIAAYRIEEQNEKCESTSTESDRKPTIANTNNFSRTRNPLLYEQQYFDELLKQNENVRKQVIEKYTLNLVERMRFYNYDQDSEDIIWPIVDKVSALSLSILGAVFQNICVQYFDYPNILCAVAKCLCSYDLTETAEWGPLILVSLLSHKNDNVKEYAVFLLENWEERRLLPILKNLDCQASWLREYINSVIYNLEGKNVLR